MNVDGAPRPSKPKAIVLRKKSYVEWLVWIGRLPLLSMSRSEGWYAHKVLMVNLDIAKSHRVHKSNPTVRICPDLIFDVRWRIGWCDVYIFVRIITFLRLRRYTNLGNVQVCCEPDKESARRGANSDFSNVWSASLRSESYSSLGR